MPVYEYTALNKKGKNVSGVIDAEGASAARQKIRADGNFPVSIDEIKGATGRKTIKIHAPRSLARTFSRIRPAEVTIMTRQLATLVGAGFPLVSAIDTLIPQTKSPTFTKVLTQIKDAVVEGSSFASALSQYPSAFSQLYVNMVRAGESSGTLEIVLERLADFNEKQQALKSKLQASLAYPILMACIGVLVLILLMTFVIPNITSIFEDMHQTLPTPTIILIGISELFKSFWWILLILLAGGIFAFKSVAKTEKGRRGIDRTKLRLPIFGVLTKKLAAARFARTLGSLLDNGVSMMPALEIVKNIAGNVIIAETVEAAAISVEKGRGLGDSLADASVIPNLAIQMIQVGEQSGELEQMLIKVADVFEREVESSVVSMTSLLEPLMIVLMAMVVAFIVMSIILPIFEMNQLVG
jgi:general secretion pathway protein F